MDGVRYVEKRDFTKLQRPESGEIQKYRYQTVERDRVTYVGDQIVEIYKDPHTGERYTDVADPIRCWRLDSGKI